MSSTQWKKREGYGGPESFPVNDLAAFKIGTTKALAGQKYSLYLSDGRVLDYSFTTESIVNVESQDGDSVKCCHYSATESASGIFFISHDCNDNERLTTCVILDLNRNQTTVITGEIPAEGDDDFRIRKSHVNGIIGEPKTQNEVVGPGFPSEIVGKRFVAEYSESYAWELIYMNECCAAWQGLKGNPGIGDTEEYHASSFAPGVYAVSWSEGKETLAAVFLYNFNTKTITGHMWGYAPESQKFLHAPLGGRIVDPLEFGLKHTLPSDSSTENDILQRNKDVVLRAHHEVWNQGNYASIPEIYSEDYQSHFICGVEVSGQDGVQNFITKHREAFPDWKEKVVDIIAEGDRVVTRYISTGKHLGEFQGVAATGREVSIAEVSIHRVCNGKIVEQWGFPDGLSHMQQIT
jgi:steroid delta-isomerase-like uncharacterized protein